MAWNREENQIFFYFFALIQTYVKQIMRVLMGFWAEGQAECSGYY